MQEACETQLEIVCPCWLEATGHDGGVLVKRTPLVDFDHEWCAPAREWIETHGLVLLAEETVEDARWMFGEYVSTLYGVPDDSPGWQRVGVVGDA
jgi:hypothetical protein